jgi:thioesterase domain-containing protein
MEGLWKFAMIGFFLPRMNWLDSNAAGATDRSERALPFGSDGSYSSVLVSDVEAGVIGIWESILGIQGINAADDFFALGGDSLAATVMLTRVLHRLGLDDGLLNRLDFFDDPTVAGLTKILQSAAARSAPEHRSVSESGEARVLTFQGEGFRTPIVCFSAKINGLPYYLRHLSKSLGPEQPFYAVAPPAAVENNRLLPIEELAQRSVAALRELIPHGPYVIAGHCYGGVLAYEASRQLIGAGQTVSMLLLFDVPAPGYPKVLRHWKRYLRAAGALTHPREVLDHIRRLAQLASRKYGGRVLRALAASGSQIDANRPELASMTMEEYRPRSIPVAITHFISAGEETSTLVLDDPRLGWNEWAHSGLEVLRVPGDHFAMFAPENALALAARIMKTLRPAARAASAVAG